jgi:hypothetical protein
MKDVDQLPSLEEGALVHKRTNSEVLLSSVKQTFGVIRNNAGPSEAPEAMTIPAHHCLVLLQYFTQSNFYLSTASVRVAAKAPLLL